MQRDPRQYSRLLVLGGLLPLLVLDVAVGLPSGVFLGGSGLVLLAAAAVHGVGGQLRAAAGWVVFAVSLGLFAVVDVSTDPLYVLVILALLAAGVLLLASERVTGDSDGGTDAKADGNEIGDRDGNENGSRDGNENGSRDGNENGSRDGNENGDRDTNGDGNGKEGPD